MMKNTSTKNTAFHKSDANYLHSMIIINSTEMSSTLEMASKKFKIIYRSAKS